MKQDRTAAQLRSIIVQAGTRGGFTQIVLVALGSNQWTVDGFEAVDLEAAAQELAWILPQMREEYALIDTPARLAA